MYEKARDIYAKALGELEDAGLTKVERVLLGPQGGRILVRPPGEGERPREVRNFCANNYLGLSPDPEVLAAARRALDTHGFGLSSVRFICGTQDLHKTLEARLSAFLGTEDTILYSSAFDANGGLFETLLGEEDAVLSDALNHASIIDGIRLCKAERHRYPNGDLGVLEALLQATQHRRLRLIATDGVFSMDGSFARLDAIAALADRYDALLMVDDSHATGFVGPTGRGTPELFGVGPRVDVVTSTLGKALGGASGGFASGRRELIALLRQRSRPYLFSNTLCPSIAAATLAVLDRLERSTELRDRVTENARYFREAMTAAGFALKPGAHPIVPVMLGDARLARDLAASLLEQGVYVIGFSFPVVPRGEARIRVQLSAVHTRDDLDLAVGAFTRVGRAYGVIA
jgi:glycine C-acetyltransferase